MKIIFKFVFVLCLLAAIRGEDPDDKKDEPKEKPTDPPKTTTTTTTTTEKPKTEETPSTTPSTTTTSQTPAVTPAVNQAYPQYSPFGFYPGFYPGFAQPQVVPNLGVRINLDSETTEASPKVPQDVPVQSYAGAFPLRQNPFPNNPFLGQFPGRGVSAYSGTFSG